MTYPQPRASGVEGPPAMELTAFGWVVKQPMLGDVPPSDTSTGPQQPNLGSGPLPPVDPTALTAGGVVQPMLGAVQPRAADPALGDVPMDVLVRTFQRAPGPAAIRAGLEIARRFAAVTAGDPTNNGN